MDIQSECVVRSTPPRTASSIVVGSNDDVADTFDTSMVWWTR